MQPCVCVCLLCCLQHRAGCVGSLPRGPRQVHMVGQHTNHLIRFHRRGESAQTAWLPPPSWDAFTCRQAHAHSSYVHITIPQRHSYKGGVSSHCRRPCTCLARTREGDRGYQHAHTCIHHLSGLAARQSNLNRRCLNLGSPVLLKFHAPLKRSWCDGTFLYVLGMWCPAGVSRTLS